MTTEIGNPSPKQKRTMHPNSLANLKPAWAKGQSGNPQGNPDSGPVVTPSLRRFSSMTVDQVQQLKERADLTIAEAIAVTMLTDALTTGAFTTGSKSREQVISRLDGDKPDVQVNVAVGVQLAWNDGGQA